MMVAVLLFRDEISPRFGATRMVLVVEFRQGMEVSRRFLDLGGICPEEIPRRLAEERVRVLICGGIHARFQALIEAEGIDLYNGLVGPADQALELYRQGRLQPGQFLCPGDGGGRRGRGRGGGRHRRGSG